MNVFCCQGKREGKQVIREEEMVRKLGTGNQRNKCMKNERLLCREIYKKRYRKRKENFHIFFLFIFT